MALKPFQIMASFGLVFLGACSQPASNSSPEAAQPVVTSPMPASTPAASPTTQAKTNDTHQHGEPGGQVIETGTYHLEFLAFPAANGTQLEFFLQKGNDHKPIPDAQVTAQVQLPDGSQQSLDLTYDTAGKHYHGLLPGTIPGAYRVVILSNIKGKKVNGRFSFKR